MYSLLTWIQQLSCGRNSSSILWSNASLTSPLPHVQTYLGYQMNSRNFLCKNEAFKQAKCTGLPNHLSKYKNLWNKATSTLHSAKRQYSNNFDNPDCKAFWKTVKSITLKNQLSPPWITMGQQSMMTKRKQRSSTPSLLNVLSPYPHSHLEKKFSSNEGDNLCLDNFLCNVEEILELLLLIDTTKAKYNGPDRISDSTLKATANAIFPRQLLSSINLSEME